MAWWVGEQAAKALVTLEDAIGVTEEMLLALDEGRSTVFPATRGQGSDPSTRFGVKAGFDGTHRQPGLKIGTYWPTNVAHGLANHGSTTLLLDDDTGALQAMVASTHLTALRTAAMDAVAVKHLARADASCLALFGTGHQAYFDALAISRVRKIERILVCGRRDDAAHFLALRLREAGFSASVDRAESAVPLADIISTVTASRTPLFDASWVAPGCHLASMGSDGPGKQELPPDLLRRASAWADLPAQSVVMGEFQHAVAAGILDLATINPLGGVVSGRIAGRGHAEEITVFDSSGIALQDLAIAQLLLVRARQTGQAGWIDLG